MRTPLETATPQSAPPGKFAAAVSVGEKNRLLISKETRDLFGINPGHMTLLPPDIDRSITLARRGYYQDFLEAALDSPVTPLISGGRETS